MFGDKKKITDSERSLISETVSIEGTINSSGAIDVAGLVKGPVYSKEIIVRETGSVTGTIEADRVEVHGHLDGKISGKIVVGASVQLKVILNLLTTLKLKTVLILMVTLKKQITLNLNYLVISYLEKKKRKIQLKTKKDQKLLIKKL